MSKGLCIIWVALLGWLTACGMAQVAVRPDTAALFARATAVKGTPPQLDTTSAPPLTPASTAAAAATATPLPSATPSPTVAPQVVGYSAYRLRAGDTLEQVSALGGSTPDLVLRYNRLTSTPQPGRELIIPRLANAASQLAPTALMALRGNTTQRAVALTFDCVEVNADTEKLLNILAGAKLRVTFFMLGSSIKHNAAFVERLVRDGHEIANHSYSHRDFSKLTAQEIGDELAQMETALQTLVGAERTTRPLFRFPYGAHNPAAVQAVIDHGYLPIGWSVDPADSYGKHRTPPEIAASVARQLPEPAVPGAIILAHCMNPTIDAVPLILADLNQRGIAVRTVSEVLGP